MLKPLKKYKLKLTSVESLTELLQEQYNEACKNIEISQNEMNKLSSSVSLNEEAMDAKAKYAKAMKDYIDAKDKALGRKLEIAKLMAEIIKFDGNVKKTLDESEAVGDWSSLLEQSREENEKAAEAGGEPEKVEYHLK